MDRRTHQRQLDSAELARRRRKLCCQQLHYKHGWVLNIHPKGYNFFIGMDHVLGKTSKEGIPLSSNASLALGMSIAW